MMDDIQKVMDRIRKLHAKAESAQEIGSVEEALAFAEAVQRMLLKYDLEMSEVEAAAQEREDPIKLHLFRPEEFGFKASRTKRSWQAYLASAVAEAHSCTVVFQKGTNAFLLIGRRRDRGVAEYMIVTLMRFCQTQAEQDYVTFFYQCRAEGDVTKAQGYKAGWYYGFLTRLEERYKKDQDDMLRQAEQAGHGMAVMRIKDQLVKVKAVADEISTGKTTTTVKSKSLDGLQQGRLRADEVNLNAAVVQGERHASQRLGQGQRQLGSGR